MFDLATLGTALAVANSAKSLLGGVFGGSKDEGDSMKSQYAWNAYSTYMNPSHQVAGLRRAGLNPMLAVSKGIASAPTVTSSPGADSNAATARQQAATAATVAAAQVENLRTNSAKNLADADYSKALAENERNQKPEVLASQGALNRASALLENMRAGLTDQDIRTRTFDAKIRELDHAFHAENYGNRTQLANVELARARAELQSARTKADVDKALLKYERIAAMARDASGAITGMIPWARFFGNSAKSIRK